MRIIHTESLAKHYDYYQKEQGLKNSVKNVLHRKKLIKEAVNGISFSLDEGEVVGFIGPNGAGKTTTLKMLSGILFPTSGTALVNGYVPWERKKQFKMGISIVMGQKTQLNWDLPAIESFNLNKHIYEINDADYKRTLAELTELLAVKDLLKIQIRRLSLGERMKIELIASLLHRPQIIFLDEPTIGLDMVSQKAVRDFIKCYNQQTGATILLTSHYISDIQSLCKRSIIINGGRIAYDGSLAGINETFSQCKLVKFRLSETVSEKSISRFGTVKEYDGTNAVLEIDKDFIKERSKAILDMLPVDDFNIEDISIEDAIAKIYFKNA